MMFPDTSNIQQSAERAQSASRSEYEYAYATWTPTPTRRDASTVVNAFPRYSPAQQPLRQVTH